LKEGIGAAPRLSKVTEFQAWLVLNMSKYYREKEAVEIAEKLCEKQGENQWAWFALTGALNASEGRGEEALEASQKALSLAPDHPDIIWMRAETLMRQKKHDEAIAFVDDSLARVQNPSELLTVKGSSLYQKSNQGRDQGQFDLALKAWEEARRIDPLNLNAYYLPGYFLHAVKRVEEALPLLEKAAGLAPETTSVHQALWRAIRGSTQKSAEEKRNEIETDMDSFLQARGDTPGALYAASSMSSQMEMKEEKKILEEKLLNMFPGSRWT
jgi:tetratricopeptide (TPR) repeat protein